MFSEFIETVPDAMVVIDGTRTVRFLNRCAEELFGYPRVELLGQPLEVLVPASSRAHHGELVSAFVAAPRRRSMGAHPALVARRKDGTEFSAGIALNPVAIDGLPHFVAVIRDITPYQRATEDSLIRELVTLTHAGRWEFDFATRQRTLSPELVSVLAWPQHRFTEAEFLDRVHPDDRAWVASLGTSVPATGPFRAIRLAHGLGGWRWIESRGVVDRDPGGRPLRMRSLAIDVTAQRDSEEQLAQREAQHRLVLASIPELVLIVDARGTVLFINHAVKIPEPELLHRSVLDFLTEPARQAFEEALARALGGAPLKFETEVVLAGECLRFENRLQLLPGHGPDVRLLLISTDITLARRNEVEVADFRAAMENALEGFAKIDLDGKFISANAAYARMLGHLPAELVGLDVLTTVASNDLGRLAAARTELLVAGRAEVELIGVRKDGSLFPKQVTMILAQDASRRVVGHYCFVRDVSEQRRIREQLLVSDRMASVGILAAGVAHEINNPLAALIANLHAAQADLAELGAGVTPEVTEELSDAALAASRVREIVRDLKIFSRHEDLSIHAVDVKQLMESTLRMARNEIRHRARLSTDYQPDLPAVEGNEARLCQVFLNLVVNAAQAIPAGNVAANEIRISASRESSGRVAIDISDTGVGISPEDRAKLFLPFFTTKPTGVGTGLGLSICHRIITGLKGTILVESTLGKGSTFRVLLPAAIEPPEVTPPVRLVERARSRRGRVLVIDDEVMVGTAIQRCLSHAHDVVAVTRGAEGLLLLAEGQAFDVIFCDLMMPQMTGVELHAALCARHPEHAERVIFITGGAFTRGAREFLEKVRNPRLDKPFDPATLVALVDSRMR